MRTTVLNHFHTFHPEAQAEVKRLAAQESELTLKIARRGEEDEPPARRRMSQPAEDLEAQLAAVREQMEPLKATIASGVVRVTLQGLPRRAKGGSGRSTYRRLMLEHPPRDDDPLDQQLGYNVDTFGDALIQACILSTTDLDGEPVENRWDEWADEMTDGQWREFFEAALDLQREGNPTTFPR
ncbi:hypothetical protein [Phycicoccus jejuensis]|uniref:hypothetical protein n=1 Tax=Phycicoccus jejuensis TaxID=367299 RepID=UPI0004C3F7B9|nr:hypothetical protein [Phycicoccus jejuensis]